MSDLLLFFGTIVGVIVVVLTLYALEKASSCWHKWGAWDANETDDCYVQSRRCFKCGYTQREQFRKLKESKDVAST